MPQSPPASFALTPQPTVFIVNVISPHPGRQDDAFAIIEDVVRHAAAKPGFVWSNLSRSTDGRRIVNIEAISDPGRVEAFFGDRVFAAKFERLHAIATCEFHTYRVGELIFPAHPGVPG
jgi:hypothetical protein